MSMSNGGKKIADSLYTIPNGYQLYKDTGYQEYCVIDVTNFQPTNKTRSKELFENKKVLNLEI